jgi:hypothetical protein
MTKQIAGKIELDQSRMVKVMDLWVYWKGSHPLLIQRVINPCAIIVELIVMQRRPWPSASPVIPRFAKSDVDWQNIPL